MHAGSVHSHPDQVLEDSRSPHQLWTCGNADEVAAKKVERITKPVGVAKSQGKVVLHNVLAAEVQLD